MYTRLLFPTDGSEPARETLDYALDVAAAHDATLHLLHVADTNQDSLTRVGGEVVDVLERQGAEIVQEAAAAARERGVSTVTDVMQGDPVLTIVDYVDAYDIDMVVMPTHGRSGLSRVLLGSVTERTIGSVDVPVLAVTPDDAPFTYPPRRVLVGTDGSAAADRAVATGVDLAAATGAALHLLHVVETASLGFDVRSALASDQLDAAGEEILGEAVAVAEQAGLDDVTSSLAHGRAYRELRSYVRDNDVDLAVLGVQGQTDFSRFVLGGVATKVVRSSAAPVLLCPSPDPDSDSDPDQ